MDSRAAKTVVFRRELAKLMPGYKWTIHKTSWVDGRYLKATGIQSSGSNRISTLEVVRHEVDALVSYESQSAGYGVDSKWLTDTPVYGATLAQSLRRLQGCYEAQRSIYAGAVASLETGRGRVRHSSQAQVTRREAQDGETEDSMAGASAGDAGGIPPVSEGSRPAGS